jgi:sigma-B regulation protein RsbU (phosphoserine phosphatase)
MNNGHGRVLLAAGDQALCSQFANELETLGYGITCVEDADRALETLLRERFDLLLLDITLPGMDDCHILEHIRGNSKLAELPVIVVSSSVNVPQITRCIELGSDDYLLAPFTPPLLQARISIALERRRLQKQENEDCAKALKLADELQEVILPVGIALSEETDFDRLVERILLEAKKVANADAGTLYLHTDDDKLKFAIMLTDSLGVALGGSTGKPITFKPLPLYMENGEPNVHNVSSYVALTGRSVKVADVYHTEEFDFSATKKFDELNGYRTKSVLTVPLKNNKDEVIGVLQLINSLDPETGEVSEFDFYEQLVIETLASQAAVALNSQLVMRRQAELLKVERDVQVGHNIQANFLPKNEELPRPKGWEIVTCLHPARQVAGDFYDTFEMTHDRIGFLIADVCDKGVGAALFMALMRSLTRAFAQQHYAVDLAGVLENEQGGLDRAKESNVVLPSVGSLALEKGVQLTNDYVATNHGSLAMFATMFFGVLNPASGSVLYINGGHNPPIIVDAQGQVKARLDPTGPAVGMFAGATFEIHRVQLAPGDSLVCFTDGVPDARDPDNKLFGEKHLLDLVSAPAPSAEALLKRIESELFAHISSADQFDDITMMIVRHTP